MNDNHTCRCADCGRTMPGGDFVSPLDVAKKWLPFCVILIIAQTLGFTALITWRETANGFAGVNELVIAVVSGTAPAATLFIVYAITATALTDFIGGGVMVTARYLTKKLIEPLERKRREERAAMERRILEGVERGRAEGVAQGRAQGRAEGVAQGAERERRAWMAWNSRRVDAEANGLPFDEPPPAV